MILPFFLSGRLRYGHFRGVEHILNENTVPRGGIVDQHMQSPYSAALRGKLALQALRADDLVVLNDGAARQVCGQERTTKCVITFIFSAALCISSFVGNLSGSVFTISNALYFDPA